MVGQDTGRTAGPHVMGVTHRAVGWRPCRCSRSTPATPVRAPARGPSTSPTAHVRTPAFVPLATKAVLKTLEPHEVARPRLRHGARQHVPPVPDARPRARRASSAACTSSCAGSTRSSPTPAASRSSRWATGRWPTRSRAARRRRRATASGRARSSSIEEDGVRSAPTSTARARFMGPETSMEVQAALGSDIALVFDECTPFHVTRDYTARSTERTHRWLDRCLAWHAEHGPDGPGRLRDRAGRHGGGPAPRLGAGGRRARPGGIAIGGSLGADKPQMYEVVELGGRRAAGGPPAPPARDRRRRRPDPRRRARASTRSTARCRRASAATAWPSCRTRQALAGGPRQGALASARTSR